MQVLFLSDTLTSVLSYSSSYNNPTMLFLLLLETALFLLQAASKNIFDSFVAAMGNHRHLHQSLSPEWHCCLCCVKHFYGKH